jgi:hypothetical protein
MLDGELAVVVVILVGLLFYPKLVGEVALFNGSYRGK